ncbi:MAG: hypothetical protein IKP40_13940 [Clostridia bacterium]|nr:hypothetical protein [Clostridia bacterium]
MIWAVGIISVVALAALIAGYKWLDKREREEAQWRQWEHDVRERLRKTRAEEQDAEWLYKMAEEEHGDGGHQ